MHAMLGAEWHIMVNPFTALVALGALLAWGFTISSVWDKDAQYWHFDRRNWNLAHLICGLAGFAVMIAPIPVWWWFIVGFPVGLAVMSASSIAYWIHHNKNVPEDKKFRLTAEGIRQRLQRRAIAARSKAATIGLVDSKGGARVIPAKDDPLFGVHVAMEDILSAAFLARASVIEVVPGPGGAYQVSQTVDGVRYRREPVDAATSSAVIDYLKSAAGLDVADKRRRQVGDFTAKFGLDSHALRLRTAGSSAGQTLTLEIDLKKSINIPPDKLGILPRQLEQLGKAVEDRHGVVLVSAPPDQGRTTTMYSLLRRHDAFTCNIRTLEIEHLLTIDGVGHSEFAPTPEGPDFATQLRSILRRDPHIVLIAELMDGRTAQEAAFPGPNGPLIYLGIRAERGVDALVAWTKAVGDLPKASAPLRAVVSQKLIRKLCDNCRVAYQPPPEQLRKLGLPAEQVKQLFKASGKIIEKNREETCPACAGLGYVGQTGVFEVMVFDNDTRALLAKGDLNGLRTDMRRKGMIPLEQAALRKAIDGVTSIEEVIRVTRPAEAPASPGKTGGAAPTSGSTPPTPAAVP